MVLTRFNVIFYFFLYGWIKTLRLFKLLQSSIADQIKQFLLLLGKYQIKYFKDQRIILYVYTKRKYYFKISLNLSKSVDLPIKENHIWLFGTYLVLKCFKRLFVNCQFKIHYLEVQLVKIFLKRTISKINADRHQRRYF